ncbi:methylated-DNA--[protein]-cysteine S-methyltransferase [Frigidibacter sp. MR17.14]|uniref:methylated-DNA--[protein]-cysteine S-methyltransferase n=1 Tax=Frigidibacter sp. MR17.14 TaxID=3126509 RepID=UPI003012D9F6
MATLAVGSPYGRLTVTEANGRITHLRWGGPDEGPPSALLVEAAAQLQAYFDGRLRVFDLPLDLGTGFAARFRQALIDIPFGQTRSYGEIARDLGISAQAAGQACGGNPIPIIVPCHRVLGTGHLGGFSAPGGVETKIALLRHEGTEIPGQGGLLL